jgi:transcriptional regulator with XRE-family HTH domain
MGLTQVQLGERLRITGNTIARFERGEFTIPPPIGLLIEMVAREAGVDLASHEERGRGPAQGKRAHTKASKTAKS